MKVGALYLVSMLLTVLALAQSVYAGGCFVDGNALVQSMKSHDKVETGGGASATDFLLGARYQSYLSGVYDVTRLNYHFPDNVNFGQLGAIVAKYLKAHPERWAECADKLVVDALKEAFPKKP